MAFDRYKIYNGKSISDWSKETGVKASTIAYRLQKGMSIEEAVSAPLKTASEAARKHDYVGKVFQDRFGNDFIVEGIAERDKYSAARYKIRFLKSGYETVASGSQILGTGHSHVMDKLSPSVFGVGILGYTNGKDNPKIFDIWRAMIARCYNPKNPSYKNYGAKGVTVCERWKRYDYFLEDIVKLPGYDKEMIDVGKLTIDKDIIDRNQMTYSPETCCFVSREENARESANRRWHKNEV